MTFILWVSLLLPLSSAFGSLGDRENSISLDVSNLRITQQSTSRQPRFRIHQITSPNYTLQEYVSTEGVIFAVTWRGRTTPDLAQLLGSYFNETKEALEKSTRSHGRTPKTLATQNIVLERGGHMRDVYGKAYLPALIPKGVDVQDIH